MNGNYLLYFSHDPQWIWFGHIARELRRQLDCPMHLWVLGAAARQAALRQGAYDNVWALLEDFDPRKAGENLTANLALLTDFERESGVGVQEAIAADRHLARRRWPQDLAIHYAAHLLQAMRRALVQAGGTPRACFGENNTLAYQIAHGLLARESPYWIFSVVRLWDERFFWDRNQAEQWPECRALYHEYCDGALPPPLQETSRRRWREIREGAFKPPYYARQHRGSGPLLPRIKHHAADWLRRPRSAEFRVNPSLPAPWQIHPLPRLARAFVQELRKHYLISYAVKSLAGRRYAIYFLHLQPEHGVEGLAFEYRNQIALIENIAAALPAEMVLLVKEHRVCTGTRPISYYRALRRIRNVILVHDLSNTAALIAGAAAVFTLTGTVALEAMCLGIPAVIFADIFFDEFEGIYKAKSYPELRVLMRRLRLGRLPGGSPHAAQAALAAMFAASFPGKIGDAYSEEEMFTSENLAALAHSVRAQLTAAGIVSAPPSERLLFL